ncbi:MAG TPA: hypothetical protein ENI99_03740 [Sedimenticola sp.]|nr:hypothetical protein [Sedimenticola sp.]
MALTPSLALEQYQHNADALQDIVDNDDSTEEQVNAASEAMDKLNADFINAVEQELEALTAQYNGFIGYMEGVVAELSAGGPLSVLESVNDALAGAKEAVSS